MSTSSFRSLASPDDWTDAVDRSAEGPVLIFKHSNRCPTSARADGEMDTLAASGDVPVYKVVVQDHRALSDTIAETLGVEHQTPQAILLVDGAAAFDVSHRHVKADAIREELTAIDA